MEKGENALTLNVLKDIDLGSVEDFINEVKKRDIKTFSNYEEIVSIYTKQYQELNLTKEEKQKISFYLKFYTGNAYDRINALLRNNWQYQEQGILTPEVEQKYQEFLDEIRNIFSLSPVNNLNFVTYRSVPLAIFQSYGINSKEELLSLKNKYYFDPGFVSTSLLNSWQLVKDNVEMQIIVPLECTEAFPLIGSNLSLHVGETEYLIANDSLFKVYDVERNGDKTTLKMVYIPKKIWQREINCQKNK